MVIKGCCILTFFLKPVDGCHDQMTGNDTAEITWESNGLTDQGISNMYGIAKNFHIELIPESGGTDVAEIDSGSSPVKSGDKIKTGFQTVAYNTVADGADPNVSPRPFKYKVKFVSDKASRHC
ncbi:hypothetical protein H8526_005337 [Salmonella enterica]|nr:hypothetical protein [Salmonella enterica]EGA8138185.1 hypothetical protein [Salmonella enterica]EGC1291124.1 hypothetical protein [Salmonella enterica]